MTWNDRKKQLTIYPCEGGYDGMLKERNFRITLVNGQDGLGLDNVSQTVNVAYKGKKLNIKLS